MKRLVRTFGSLRIAVPLLIAIAAVLAWGTIYETRFGTAAVQRFVYQAWWFQALLAFLAANLAVAALQRWPWKRRHVPFVLAHIGIILILLGGIIGGRFGIEGQMIIPEGQAEHTIETPGNVLTVHLPTPPPAASAVGGSAQSAGPFRPAAGGGANPGAHQVLPTRFETQAWVQEPNTVFPVTLAGRSIELVVDRYYPDAVTDERVTDGGTEENPAAHVLLEHDGQQEDVWLFARNPERFGMGWGEAHVLFLEPKTPALIEQLVSPDTAAAAPRGVVSVRLPGTKAARDIPVPAQFNQTIAIDGTPYQVTFKDYFPDFAITEQGLVSRSAQPNNPAVSLTLSGPEGTDAYLLFALHPEFQSMHGFEHKIPADVSYAHAASGSLPPNSIAFIRATAGHLIAVLTGAAGERDVIKAIEIGTFYTHRWLGYRFQVAAFYPRAVLEQQITNRSESVKAEALHVTAREGDQTVEAWLGLRQRVQLDLGKEPLVVEYRPGRRELPVTIKLLDFRKIDYPGTQMASGFEADVQLTDAKRGIILMRKISMNNPLRYRGFSFFQSSYIDGPTQTTVLSVRSDPGTPLVYAGFIIVIAGVVSLFAFRHVPIEPARRSSPRRARTRRTT